jgi:thioredoxin-like negative regulator of GroEL
MTSPATRQGAVSTSKKPMLLLFTSPTDGHSRRVQGYLAQVLQRRHNHDTFNLQIIDVAQRSDLVQRLRIDQVPTLIAVDERRVQGRLSNPRGCSEIQTFLAPWLR